MRCVRPVTRWSVCIPVGDWSDNVRTICQQVYRPSGWNGISLVVIRKQFSISEELPRNTTSAKYWFSGASCFNAFCDNMFYWETAVNFDL